MHLLACTFVFSMQAPFAWVFPVGSHRERVCEQIVSGSLSISTCDLTPLQTHWKAFGVFICFCTHLHLCTSGPCNWCSNNWSNQHSTGDFLFLHVAGKFSWCLKLRCVILHHLIFFAMGKHNALHERMVHQYQRLFGVSQSCFHQISFWIWTLQSPTFAGMSSLPLYSQGCWWSWGCRQPCKQWSAVWTSSPPKRLGSQYQIIYLWMATGYQTDSRRKRHNVLWRCCTNCPLLIRVLLLL